MEGKKNSIFPNFIFSKNENENENTPENNLPVQNIRDRKRKTSQNSRAPLTSYILLRYPQTQTITTRWKCERQKRRQPKTTKEKSSLTHSHTLQKKKMAAESVRVSASSACNFSFNGSQRRLTVPLSPARFLGLRPRRQSSSSSSSSYLGTVRLNSISSKPSTSLSRRNFSVFAMATEGLSLSLSLSLSLIV